MSQTEYHVPEYEFETQPLGSSEFVKTDYLRVYFHCEMTFCEEKSTVKMNSRYHGRSFDVCETHAKNLLWEFRSDMTDSGSL